MTTLTSFIPNLELPSINIPSAEIRIDDVSSDLIQFLPVLDISSPSITEINTSAPWVDLPSIPLPDNFLSYQPVLDIGYPSLSLPEIDWAGFVSDIINVDIPSFEIPQVEVASNEISVSEFIDRITFKPILDVQSIPLFGIPTEEDLISYLTNIPTIDDLKSFIDVPSLSEFINASFIL